MITKVCTRCHKRKNTTDFGTKNKALGLTHTRCKDCRREINGSLPKRYLLSDVSRECVACRRFLPATEFAFKNKDCQRRQSRCRPCMKEYNEHNGVWDLLYSRHRITKTQYTAIYEHQMGRCAICGTVKSGVGQNKLYVDHNHNTGVVRGLLCMSCNTALGHFRDNRELLVRAVDYLDRVDELGALSGPHH